MSNKFEKMSVFEQIRAGLEDSIAWSKGQISLKTTTLPAPPPKAGAAHISSLRRSLNMSQAVFAATINVSPKTIQSWEQGTRVPSDAALRLIQVVALQPGIVKQLFSASAGSVSRQITRKKVTVSATRKSAHGRKRKLRA
jgi:putative transcriptional regulator